MKNSKYLQICGRANRSGIRQTCFQQTHSEEIVFIAALAWNWCSDHVLVSQELRSSYLTLHVPTTACNNTDIPEETPCRAEVCPNHTFFELTEVGEKSLCLKNGHLVKIKNQAC